MNLFDLYFLSLKSELRAWRQGLNQELPNLSSTSAFFNESFLKQIASSLSLSRHGLYFWGPESETLLLNFSIPIKNVNLNP